MTGMHPDIDVSSLRSYLAEELETGIEDITVLHDGINLTVAVETSSDDSYILRRPNSIRHSSVFNSIQQEYQVMDRLTTTAIPVPEPILSCDDPSLVGDRFLVMTRLAGEPVRLGGDLPERFQRPRARQRIGHALIDTLGDLHSIDGERFVDVCDETVLHEQITADVERFETALLGLDRDFPRLCTVAEWLESNVPADTNRVLCHGDFRPSNVLFTGQHEPKVNGVLDWETAFLGDPLTELGYLFLRWRDQDDQPPPVDELEKRYPDHDQLTELRRVNEHGLSPFSSKPGSPSRRELQSRYEQRTGLTVRHNRFYVAYSAFALATVWADIHRDTLDAGEPSDRAPWIEYMGLVARNAVDNWSG